ncbi:hypothetical protein [Subtercola endophyticus]|uniref:hypothetical protein n=1 Tax=Subtercola endophyticus TaxID=2895559 RepID=UPI001E50743B|nr:hypothetical protein [Subtercola endophyticus]UFS57694.1 hypothetical protein LQ955_11590 [Subtercola endophyticus]
MIGWRRKAKAERENTVSAERLYDLVNQTLLSNFGPLGSYAITHRAASDTDDIFHTVLASSVAHNIVSSLVEHKAVTLTGSLGAAPVPAPVSLAPIDAVPVPRELADAVTELRPITHPEQPAEVSAAFVDADFATAAVAEFARAEITSAEASSRSNYAEAPSEYTKAELA